VLRREMSLRGIATVAVLANHAAGTSLMAMVWWAHRYSSLSSPSYVRVGSPAYWTLTIIESACVFAVPAFLVASGAFCAYSYRSSQQSRSVRLICRSLPAVVLPFLIWSSIALLRDAVLGTPHTFSEGLVRILTGQADPAYFFVPVIIQFYLLGPLISKHVQTIGSRGALIWTFAAMVVCTLVRRGVIGHSSWFAATIPVVLDRLFIRWIFYYVLGYVLAVNSDAIPSLVRHRVGILAAMLLLYGLSLAEAASCCRSPADWAVAHDASKVSSTAYSVVMVLALVAWQPALGRRLRRVAGWLERLGMCSYGIFLVQPLLFALGSSASYRWWPTLLGYPIALCLVLFAWVACTYWMLHLLVTRTALRTVTPYLLGYRAPGGRSRAVAKEPRLQNGAREHGGVVLSDSEPRQAGVQVSALRTGQPRADRD